MKQAMMAAAGILSQVPPRGSQAFYAGTATFVVPPGVKSICVAMQAAGQQANSGSSGAGGNFRYLNDLKVTPGQTFSVTVGAVCSFGAYNTSQSTTTVLKGTNGSAGGSPSYGRSYQGGNAGGAGSGRDGSGINLVNGVVTKASGTVNNGANYGGGGGCSIDGNGNPTYRFGAPGQLRVMWGKGRAFPSTQLID